MRSEIWEMGNNSKIKQLIEKIDQIPGWLAPEAAFFTAYLLLYQKNINLTGNITEIGVYCGKYLAVLYQHANENEHVLGVDAFIGATNIEQPKQNVFQNILKICGDNRRLNIFVGDSLDLTSKDILELIHGKNTRLISIDGGHTADVVFHDLELSISILKEGGIIVMDDIFNHSLPGVTEGFFRFMFEEKNRKILAPFAHCYNKLFLTTPDHYSSYFRESLEILEEMKDYSTYQRTKTRMEENHGMSFVPELLGYEILSFL